MGRIREVTADQPETTEPLPPKRSELWIVLAFNTESEEWGCPYEYSLDSREDALGEADCMPDKWEHPRIVRVPGESKRST